MKPYFFIIGRPRTGTTLLRSLFDAHPNVQIPWECQFVLNLYPQYGKVTEWTEKVINKFCKDLADQWQFSAWNIDYNRLTSDLRNLGVSTNYRTVCETVYMSFKSFYDKGEIQWIGDKNHGYTIYTDRLKKLFPEAKFIYILRDYRDNFHSVTNVDFELPVASLVVYKWKYFYKKALKAAEKYPGDFYFMRYEDLASDPHHHFKQICEFLNIPYLPEVFEFYRMKEKAAENYPAAILEKHHKSLFNPINTGRLGLWKKAMSPGQVRIADQVAGKYAEKAGYERVYTRYSIITALHASPGVVYARFLYFMTYIIDKFPYRWREKILSKGPLWLAETIGRRLKPKKD